jgi:SpoVK/Ycf46/Vps4 family AAA+-type ATPase
MLLFSQLVRKVSLSGFLFLSIAFVFQLKSAENTQSLISVEFRSALFTIVTTLIPIAFLVYFVQKVLNKQKESLIKKDAMTELKVDKSEKFIGDFNPQFQAILDILLEFNELKTIGEKQLFFKDIPPRYLFYGPPGTGKGHSVKRLFLELKKAGLNVSFRNVTEVETGFMGGGSNALTFIFNEIEKDTRKKEQIGVLVFDELSSVFPLAAHLVVSKTTDQFKKLTDGFESLAWPILIIGLTNNLDGVDTAVRSRFLCQKFKADPGVLRQILEETFADLNDFPLLRRCLDEKIIFKSTGEPFSVRDVITIKQNLNLIAFRVTQRKTKDFTSLLVDQQKQLFNQIYSIKKKPIVLKGVWTNVSCLVQKELTV